MELLRFILAICKPDFDINSVIDTRIGTTIDKSE